MLAAHPPVVDRGSRPPPPSAGQGCRSCKWPVQLHQAGNRDTPRTTPARPTRAAGYAGDEEYCAREAAPSARRAGVRPPRAATKAASNAKDDPITIASNDISKVSRLRSMRPHQPSRGAHGGRRVRSDAAQQITSTPGEQPTEIWSEVPPADYKNHPDRGQRHPHGSAPRLVAQAAAPPIGDGADHERACRSCVHISR